MNIFDRFDRFIRQLFLKLADQMFFGRQILAAVLNKAADFVEQETDFILNECRCKLVQNLERQPPDPFPKPRFLLLFFPFFNFFQFVFQICFIVAHRRFALSIVFFYSIQ
ncbi:hypothetical protein CHCC5027_1513 [Bacillus paralicheniformis]|nr:hypothetical protein CHCC5027_1513 [Bacillus paralicheniformis]